MYLPHLICTTNSGQFTGQLLLSCFYVFQALNSVYEKHQHTIPANCLCLGCLISADAQDHIWDSFTVPFLSFICFEMYNLISLKPYKIKSVPQHRHFIELAMAWTNTCHLLSHFAFFTKVEYQLPRFIDVPDTAHFKQHSLNKYGEITLCVREVLESFFPSANH